MERGNDFNGMERAESNIEEIVANGAEGDQRELEQSHGRDRNQQIEIYDLEDILDFINDLDLGNEYLDVTENNFVEIPRLIAEPELEENGFRRVDRVVPDNTEDAIVLRHNPVPPEEFFNDFCEKSFRKMTDPKFVQYLVFHSGLGVVAKIVVERNFEKSLELTLDCGKTPAQIMNEFQWKRGELESKYRETVMFMLMTMYFDDDNKIKNHPCAKACTKSFVEIAYFYTQCKFTWSPYLHDMKHGVFTPAAPELDLEPAFFFNETRSTWQAFARCFHPKIFYPQLYIEFFSYAHFILIRYLAYIEETYNRCVIRARILPMALDLLLDISKLQYFAGWNAFEDPEKSLYYDFMELYLKEIYELSVAAERNLTMCSVRIQNSYVTECVDDLEKLLSLQPMVSEFSTPHFAPFQPSRYIQNIVKEIKNILAECKRRPLLKILCDKMFNLIVKEFSVRYQAHIQELKEYITREHPDYDKTFLKAQLKRDVRYFCKEMSEFVKPYTREFLIDLHQFVS